MLAPPLDSGPPSVASRLRRRRLASPSLPGQQCGEAAVRWTAARLGSRVLATPPDSRRPSVASRLCRRLDSGAASSCALDSGVARQLCAGQQRGEAAVRWRRLRLEASVRRLSSHRRLDNGAVRRLRAGLTSRLGTPVRRLSSPSPPGQRRGEAAVRRRHPSTRGLRPSPLVSLPSGQRCGEAAVRWRRLSNRDARPSPLASVAAWPAARRGSSAPAPPLDSRPPSFVSRLCRHLDSGAARRLCAGAASRLETPVRRLSSPSPPVQQRGEQPCAGQRRGEAAVRWRRLRLGASVRRLSSHRRLYSGAASSCALDGGAASQLRAGAAPRLETPVRRLSSLSPLGQRRGGAAVRWRRLSTRGLCPSPLVSSPSGQRRGEAAVCWRRLSTRGARPSPLVSVAASTAARRAAVRLTAARRGSYALDSGAVRQQRDGAALDSRPPSVAARLIAVCTVARRAAVRWTAARRGSCVLAPPLDSRRPSVASHLRRRLDSGAASSYVLDSGPARQLCVGRRRARQQCAGAAIDSRPPSVASRLIAAWTAALRGGYALDSGAARQLCAGQRAARQLCAGAAS